MKEHEAPHWGNQEKEPTHSVSYRNEVRGTQSHVGRGNSLEHGKELAEKHAKKSGKGWLDWYPDEKNHSTRGEANHTAGAYYDVEPL
jgi:hypothetical protein